MSPISQANKITDQSLNLPNLFNKDPLSKHFEYCPSNTNSHIPTPVTQLQNKISVCNKKFPNSISITQMLKLGKPIAAQEQKFTVKVQQFDIFKMTWSAPNECSIMISKESFAEGGFRKAFKASGKVLGITGVWVVKKYKEETLEAIKALGQTKEEYTKRVIQMHALAKRFCEELQETVQDICPGFGQVPRYYDAYMALIDDEYVTLEEYIHGPFVKYINNTGIIEKSEDHMIHEKIECLAHFTYEKSSKQLMLLDIQGSGYNLYDPEIASEVNISEGEYLFGAGNLTSTAIEQFCLAHACNTYCKMLKLPEIEFSN